MAAQIHFEHEVQLLRKCVHPHIIGCRGLYVGSEDLAIVLDLMAGGDCQQLLKRHGALAEPVVHTIMEQLFSALACVHGTRECREANMARSRPGAEGDFSSIGAFHRDGGQ